MIIKRLIFLTSKFKTNSLHQLKTRVTYNENINVCTVYLSYCQPMHLQKIFFLCNFTYYPSITYCKKLILPNSNNSPTRCNSFTVYYPDVYLQPNMFWAFSRPSSGAE